MWKIHSVTWGQLTAEGVYPSDTLPGTLTVHNVKRGDRAMWVKAYLPLHDLTVIEPPKEV